MTSQQDLRTKQLALCATYGVDAVDAPPSLKAGVARNVRSAKQPVNGLRHPPVGDTTGWYIWAGTELSDDPQFFVPLHVEHLEAWRPQVLPYLLLPPGYRFLIAPEYEEVWFDSALLEAK